MGATTRLNTTWRRRDAGRLVAVPARGRGGGGRDPIARLAYALALATLVGCPSFAGAQSYVAEGACRDGAPNGAYALKAGDGRLRVAGAFAKGKRTGTFLFWAANGVRLAVIPYNEDAKKSGTVATWYPEASPRGELRRKLEAPYVDDVLHGLTRSWYPNGRLRGEYRYEHGALVEASAWGESGSRLAESEARQMAAADRGAAETSYADLERFVAEHPPHCA